MTTMSDPRRYKPITIEWVGLIGRLTIDGEMWGAVEWSEKRQAFCIEDAEGRCLSHHSHIHGEDKDKAGAVALAEAMIRDGRMPTPEDANKARQERLKRDRERRAKQPAQIRRQERDRLLMAAWRAEGVERGAEVDEPLYEVLANAFDLADQELWKSNSFARLRARLIPYLQSAIASLEANRIHVVERHQRLERAREILKILTA
jgi:hypothetical protein